MSLAEDGFDIPTGADEAQQAFFVDMSLRSRAWSELLVSDDDINVLERSDAPILVTVDVRAEPEVPTEQRAVFRVLCVQVDAEAVLVGDEDGRHAGGVDTRKNFNALPGITPSNARELASQCCELIERELRRPIEMRVWKRPAFTHREWILADTGAPLIWSDSQNEKRTALGAADEIVVVRRER